MQCLLCDFGFRSMCTSLLLNDNDKPIRFDEMFGNELIIMEMKSIGK